MRSRRGLVAALSGVLLAVSGCASFADTVASEGSAPAAPSTSEAPAPEIAWTDCDAEIGELLAGRPGADRDLAFECGRTEVPITYDEPDGATLPLFLVRARLAAQTDRIGSLLVNPGGPGASGADAAIGLALTLPEQVLGRFDLVGFDPRGVGLSTPVECIPDELKEELVAADPRPTTAEQLDATFARAEEVAAGCEEEYGDALGAFNTVDTARDMDRLREALGDEQLTYLGYSYGTTLGSTYAELFPEQVRAMVLDAAVDPDADQVADAEAQAQGFEAAFDAFAAGCTGLVSGCPLGADPRAFLEELLAATAASPIPSLSPEETRQGTAGVVMTAVAAALYDDDAWPQLAQALVSARNGEPAGIFTLADSYSGRLPDGSYTNLFDANRAINCADSAEDVDEAQVRDLVGAWNARYPLFGAFAAAGLYACTPWDAPSTPLPERDAQGAAPILVIGTEGDPATPLAGAVDLAGDLESGVLVTWQGEGHTAYPKTDCVTAAVNAYLIEGTAPVDGLTCPA
ncbi:alpha/beta hydrolase [Geodermatophilus sp. YIM 151500]|uniref:alpha/beta hydrolase n=1 Tax=Geodermatophilus sp. YIM 151500 TaxID=2984531 RepID=UPI0021E3830D|nr:alpha/beta hydrolase [Geodermatophilus sp. YIM 151500]MCV2488044.1 alpha/beta hydrolase [Geodermatophilus sp. YIM 151500]